MTPNEVITPIETLLTVSDVADLMKMAKPTLYKMAKNNELPFSAVYIGRCVRFRRSEVHQFLNGEQVEEACAL